MRKRKLGEQNYRWLSATCSWSLLTLLFWLPGTCLLGRLIYVWTLYRGWLCRGHHTCPESGIKTPSHKDLMLGLGLFFPALSLQVSLRAVPAGYPAGGSWNPCFPLSLGLLQLAEHNWERNKLTYLLLLIANSFIGFTFSPPFPFIFLNDCRKYSSQFQHLPSQLGGEKGITRTGRFWSRDSAWMSPIISDVVAAERCCSDLPRPGAHRLMTGPSKAHRLFVKCVLSYFSLLHSGNLALLFAGALFLFPERGCHDASCRKPWS